MLLLVYINSENTLTVKFTTIDQERRILVDNIHFDALVRWYTYDSSIALNFGKSVYIRYE